MPKVSELMSRPLVVLKAEDLVGRAIALMSSNRAWFAPVVGEDENLVGVVSYRELLERRVGPRARISSVMYPPYSVSEESDVGDAVEKIFSLRVRGVPVVGRRNRLVGIITREDIIGHALATGALSNVNVSKVMSSPAITIEASEPVAKARWVMLRNGVSKLPVLEEGRLFGIVSMRDLAEKIYYASNPLGARSTGYFRAEEEVLAAPVREVATSPAVAVKISDPLQKIARLMLGEKISGFPVISEEKVVGMVTSYDIIKSMVRVKEDFTLEAKLSDLDDASQREALNRVVSTYIAKVARISRILDTKLVVKKLPRSSGGESAYIVSIRLKTDDDLFSVEEIGKDLLAVARRALETVFKRVVKKYERIRTIRRSRAGEEQG